MSTYLNKKSDDYLFKSPLYFKLVLILVSIFRKVSFSSSVSEEVKSSSISRKFLLNVSIRSIPFFLHICSFVFHY